MKSNLKQKALGLLARREHSRFELQNKLLLRGYDLQDIASLLDELETANLLSDDRYIGCYIRSRCARGFGPLKICASLQKQGIATNRVRTNEAWLEIEWQEMAILLRQQRFGDSLPQKKADRLKQSRFLEQRGFTSEQIYDALTTLIPMT